MLSPAAAPGVYHRLAATRHPRRAAATARARRLHRGDRGILVWEDPGEQRQITGAVMLRANQSRMAALPLVRL